MSIQTRLLATKNSNNSNSGSDFPELYLFNQHNPQRYPYLLLSSATGKNNTQFDILLACPQYLLTLSADKKLSCTKKGIDVGSRFFDTLENLYQADKNDGKSKQTEQAKHLPFTGGWFVYLSYEMAAEIEPCLSLPKLPSTQPLAVAARCPAAIVYDKRENQLLAIAEDKYAYLLDQLETDYKHITKLDHEDTAKKCTESILLDSITEEDPVRYLEQVKKIKQYIIDGDIFQANLSRQWQATLKNDVDDCVLFNALSTQNPSSFAAMACLNNMTIISSSPERLVSIKEGIVETRPIAGTRPRDNDQQNDDALAKELLEHPKEQAEHIMLIDLERNDLGRVCRPGSIEVNELMSLESWQHVHHIVSNVRGELDKNKSPIDVLRAVFPGGTITGCPKVHCIEILAEMEQQARGAYTGSLGYINNNGNMDFNILIRTMVRDKTGKQNLISFRAGGGIVNDSIAEKELEETRAKAKGLLNIFN